MTGEISSLESLERTLRYRFSDPELLREALTHASYANESGLPRFNERLEFLGDAVLELCVSETLFREHPQEEEGSLTRRRSALVCASNLARWARIWGLGSYLLLGKGMRRRGPNENILADAFEAVLGALYLDGGAGGGPGSAPGPASPGGAGARGGQGPQVPAPGGSPGRGESLPGVRTDPGGGDPPTIVGSRCRCAAGTGSSPPGRDAPSARRNDRPPSGPSSPCNRLHFSTRGIRLFSDEVPPLKRVP